MANSHALARLKLTTQREALSSFFFFFLFFFADVAWMLRGLPTNCSVWSTLLLFTPGPSRSLVMCYFVYKVITNKVFKKVTCQLLGWWIPFPQWKHASAEASNFLSCTPPKLQCRDCLVINRACTVPSLCMRLGSRERVRGGGRNSLQCTRLQASFSVFIGMVTVPPLPATPYWPESC